MKLRPVEIPVVRGGKRSRRTRWTPEDLSDRERQVMAHLAAGIRNAEIARKLFLSVKTVTTYRSRLFKKLGLENNAQMTMAAIQAGLVVRDVPTGQARAPTHAVYGFFDALLAPDDEATSHNPS